MTSEEKQLHRENLETMREDSSFIDVTLVFIYAEEVKGLLPCMCVVVVVSEASATWDT